MLSNAAQAADSRSRIVAGKELRRLTSCQYIVRHKKGHSGGAEVPLRFLEGELTVSDYLSKWHHFNSMTEVCAVDGYVRELDDKRTELQQLLGWYVFKDEEVSCGRKSCHQPHKFGFVVRDQAERVTNIGHCCGERIFGEKFAVEADQLVVSLTKAQNETARIASATAVLVQREQLLDRARELRTQAHGVDWLMRTREAYFDALPGRIVEELLTRARTLQTEISITRKRTDNDPPAAHPWETHIEQTIGRLRGLGALRYDPDSIIRNEIVRPLLRYSKTTPEQIVKDRRLKRDFTFCVNNLRGAFDRVEGVLRDAPKFFSPEGHAEVITLADTLGCGRDVEGVTWHAETGLAQRSPEQKLDPEIEAALLKEDREAEAERLREEREEERVAEAMLIRSYFKR